MPVLKVGMRGLYYEGPAFTPMPCVITRVYDPDLYGPTVNCVVTLDGNAVANEGWGNEEIAALVTWRTGVRVISPGDERTFPCVVDVA